METKKLLLSVTEVCDQIGLGPTKVRSLIRSGELESVRIGRAVRVPVSGLQKFLDAQDTARQDLF
jgi:excisionase family DNA binding protein